ncbi:hypothetical protein ACOMHN_038645 [Nucella lapillus]
MLYTTIMVLTKDIKAASCEGHNATDRQTASPINHNCLNRLPGKTPTVMMKARLGEQTLNTDTRHHLFSPSAEVILSHGGRRWGVTWSSSQTPPPADKTSVVFPPVTLVLFGWQTHQSAAWRNGLL